MRSFARPCSEMSTDADGGVGSRLTSATNAPACFAIDANPAAGYTTPDVPTTSRRSQCLSALVQQSRSSANKDSPNQTIWGRSSDLQRRQDGVTACAVGFHVHFQPVIRSRKHTRAKSIGGES